MAPKCHLIVVAVLVVLGATNGRAIGANVWLSNQLVETQVTGGAPPIINPTVSHSTSRGTGRLTIWTTLADEKTLKNFSLRLTSSRPDVVKFAVRPPGTTIPPALPTPVVHNERLKWNVDPSVTNRHRWEIVTSELFDPSPIAGLSRGILEIGGISLDGQTRIGVGIGKDGSGGPNYSDTTHYDQINKAWWLATLNYEVESFGTSDITLEATFQGMKYTDGTEAVFTFGKATISSTPPPASNADFDGSGRVDAVDLANWRSGFGVTSSATLAAGDANGDRVVDGADFLIWQRRLGSTAASTAAAAVPEPSTVVCAAIAFMGLIVGGHRRRAACCGAANPAAGSQRSVELRPRWLCCGVSCAVVCDATFGRQSSVGATEYRWQNAVNGSFSEPANWNPNGVPVGDNDAIEFRAPTLPGNSYTVTGASGRLRQLRARAGAVTLVISDLDLISPDPPFFVFGVTSSFAVGIDENFGDINLVGVPGSGSRLRTRHTSIATQVGSSGRVSVSSLDWAAGGSIFVGSQGPGWLEIGNGSTVTSLGVQLGAGPSSSDDDAPLPASGVATVSGAGSSWTNTRELEIAVRTQTSGTLTIEAGGRFINEGIVRLAQTGSIAGALNVVGENSSLTVTSDLLVGQGGEGTVSITAAARASTANAVIGDTSKGQLLVDGEDSQWNNSGGIEIGKANLGLGKLTVKGGGGTTSGSAIIGRENGSNGAAAVVGAGSLFDVNGLLTIGQSGLGSLAVFPGAAAESTIADIGVNFTGIGTATVSGQGARWENSQDMRVGVVGEGTLLVLGGAAVSSGNSSVAAAARGAGDVVIQGTNSGWDVNGRLGIGGNVVANAVGGRGAVAVQFGGRVTVTQNATVFPTGRLRVEDATFQALAVENHGVIELRSNGLAPTRLATSLNNTTAGTLMGTGQIDGQVVNRGLVAPGFSPGVITVNGNYTQPAEGVLEMEFGGPDLRQHDKLVAGTATLGGRLSIGLIDGYAPTAGSPPITFLETLGGITGKFDSIFVPQVAELRPGVALRVVPGGGNGQNLDLQFVQPITGNQLSTQPSLEWSAPGTWSGGTPDTAHIISLQNTTGVSQQVTVGSDDAFTHRLSIGGPGSGAVTVRVQEGRSLSAIDGVTVGQNGAVVLDGGTLAASTINVIGGSLSGDGTFVGDVIVRDGGRVSPGFSPGRDVVKGDYRQETGGSLDIEVDGARDGFFDFLDVKGIATPGGDVHLDLSEYTGDFPQVITFLRAERVTPGAKFDNLFLPGRDDLRAIAIYGDTFVAAAILEQGAGGDGDLNFSKELTNEDARYMAMALVNTQHYEQLFGMNSQFGVGNVNGDGIFNFDDIGPFLQLLKSQSPGLRSHAVPEPTSLALTALVIVSAAARRAHWRRHVNASAGRSPWNQT